jgi:hypothetical protein
MEGGMLFWLRWGPPLAFVILMLTGLATAAVIRQEVTTPGGPLVIKQMDEGALGTDFVVTLGQQVVIRAKEGDPETTFADFPVPKLVKYVDQPVLPFAAVAVFQQYNWGNACNGGPIWFLGIYKDGTFSVSKSIDFCGGPSPLVSVTPDGVHVVLPASTVKDGATTLAEEEWVFSENRLRRVR